MLFALLRPGKIITLAILIAIVGGAWWAWGRLHRSDPASESAALASVRDAKGADAGTPRPGVYQYLSGGDERIGLGPLSVGRKLPTSALLVVSPGPTSRTVDLRVSGDHAEGWRDAVRRGRAEGHRPDDPGRNLRLLARGDRRRRPAGAAAPGEDPKRASPGRRSTRSARSSSTATRRWLDRATITVSGRPVRTWVIQTQETVTGALHGDETRKEWWSPALGVDVRVEWHRDLEGTIQ